MFGIQTGELCTNENNGEWNSTTFAKMHVSDEVEAIQIFVSFSFVLCWKYRFQILIWVCFLH